MKGNKYFLNTALAIVLGIALLIAVIVRTFAPAVIIPQLNVPNMALLSLLALLLDYYLADGADRCYICIPVLSAAAFGLLPLAACFVGVMESLKLAFVGGIVFTVITWLFSSALERLSSGPNSKAAPVVSALGLYLAVQCFMGMIL